MLMSKYTEAARAVYSETQAALKLVYESLNQGQQNKLLKGEAVKKLLVHYGIVEDEEG